MLHHFPIATCKSTPAEEPSTQPAEEDHTSLDFQIPTVSLPLWPHITTGKGKERPQNTPGKTPTSPCPATFPALSSVSPLQTCRQTSLGPVLWGVSGPMRCLELLIIFHLLDSGAQPSLYFIICSFTLRPTSNSWNAFTLPSGIRAQLQASPQFFSEMSFPFML